MADSNNSKQTSRGKRQYGPMRAFFTVLSAFFGVQSSANKDRDEQFGSMSMFITFGLVATALLVAAIWLLVWIVMMQAG